MHLESAELETGSVPLHGLPLAQLETVHFDLLRDGDLKEARKLFEGCQKDGFFYLDIQNLGNHVLDVIEQMYRLDYDLYSLPDEEKMLYDIDKLSKMKLNGYKPVGRNFGGLNGNKDGFESYAIPKDGVLGLAGQGSFPRPPVIDRYMDTLREFVGLMNTVTASIMDSLSISLGLPEDDNLMTYHRPSMPSPDVVRLLKYHSQPIEERGALHTPHTDLGSLTFLFTRQPGLQILEPNSDQWTWVQPKTGCVIVNLGDGMSLLTNKLFRSCLHRVRPLPGQAMPTRYSFAYLVRAEDKTLMTGLKSSFIPVADSADEVFTSCGWIKQKFGMFRLESRQDDQDWVLTGQHKVLPI